VIHADRRTDGHVEANRRFELQANVSKKGKKKDWIAVIQKVIGIQKKNKQNRQRTYNATLRCVSANIVAVEKQ
jgi:hypothetical protein